MDTLRGWLRCGQFAVLAVFVTGLGPPAAAEPPKEPAKAPFTAPTKELLDKLLKAYKAYELPFPPADAPLVREATGTRSYSDDGTNTDYVALGFLIKPAKAGEPTRFFRGTGIIRDLGRREVITIAEPRPEALKDVNSFVDVELAIQCHARGWTDLALKVLEQTLGDKAPSRNTEFARSPETDLARSAWGYWQLELQKPTTDRAKVARLLKVIWELRGDDFGVAERDILYSLELALKPGKGKPGTVEGLIDDLIDVTNTDRTDALVQTKEPHPAYTKLARRGFDVVPALIEHLNDERLTRAYKHGFNNFRGYHYRVGDVVCDLLQGLAGNDVGKSWLRRLQGYRLEKDDVEKWWADARKVGEESYFVRHVLGDNTEGNFQNLLMLDVLAHKYPKLLPGVYRRMLNERPGMYGWELGKVVAAGALARETKRELFLEAARSKGTHIRIDGIVHLLEVDRTKGVDVLLAELDRVPESPEGSYWKCPETRLAYVVMKANDARAWTALEKTARRVDVGLRMEYLNQMTYRARPEGTREARLRFMSKFLDDSTIRDATASSKYDGPYAGFINFPKIEVRNFVAADLASYLRMDVEPNAQWTDAQWAKLREDVKKALAREGIR
jgi:hypothetical protein